MSTATLPVKVSLPSKGATAQINAVKMLKAVLTWNEPKDFDLFAIAVDKNKKPTMIYFDEKKRGDKNVFPFIALSGDEGISDTVKTGGNKEELVIAKIADEIDAIYLGCWDYGAAQKSQPARFGTDFKMAIISVGEQATDNLEAVLDTAGNATANGVVIASITRTPIGMEFKNVSVPFEVRIVTDDGASILSQTNLG